MEDSGQQGDLEESSSRCTNPGEVTAGGGGLGDSMENVADVHTEESGSSESDSEDQEDQMEGVEEESHDLDGDREQFADREAEEVDVDAFARELALTTVDMEAVEPRVATPSGQEEEEAEDAPEDDNHDERQRRTRRRGRRTSGSQRERAD
jgi:hypothetical protein